MKFKHFICAGVLILPLFSWAVNSTSQNDHNNQADKSLLGLVSVPDLKVSDKASDLIANAMQLLGVPYHRGGTSEASGFDCSGFVRAMYEKTIGLVLPHNAKEQASVTDKIDPSELKPGDLVFFNTMKHAFSHVGIYLGDGKFIHSPRSGSKVRIEDMRDAYWERRFNGARRVPIEQMNSEYFIRSIKADLPSNGTADTASYKR
jgi:cell wall-associated NlpC family hydrolase